MPKGVANKRYTLEFKKHVVETMLEEGLSYSETKDDLACQTSGQPLGNGSI